jgi:hypothetical protein
VAQDAGETIPLFAAAVIAYEKVFSTGRDHDVTPSVDELDLVALALSGRLPIYGVRVAMRFELGDGIVTMTQLTVHKSDLERVLDQLKRKPLNL